MSTLFSLASEESFFLEDLWASLQSKNFSLNRVVSLCWVNLPKTAQSGRPWPFLSNTAKRKDIQGHFTQRKLSPKYLAVDVTGAISEEHRVDCGALLTCEVSVKKL